MPLIRKATLGAPATRAMPSSAHSAIPAVVAREADADRQCARMLAKPESAYERVAGVIARERAPAGRTKNTAEERQAHFGWIDGDVKASIDKRTTAARRDSEPESESVTMAAELERRTAHIGDIVMAVARIECF